MISDEIKKEMNKGVERCKNVYNRREDYRIYRIFGSDGYYHYYRSDEQQFSLVDCSTNIPLEGTNTVHIVTADELMELAQVSPAEFDAQKFTVKELLACGLTEGQIKDLKGFSLKLVKPEE